MKTMSRSAHLSLLLSHVAVALTSVLIGQASFADTPAPAGAGPLAVGAPAAAGGDIVLAHFQHPDTHEQIDVVGQASSADELKKHSPGALANEDAQMRAQVEAQCSSKQNVIRQVAHDFPGEAGAFYTGLAMSAQLQMHGDPASFQHFYHQSITNVMGHVSFAFFMLGSRVTTDALSMMGLAFDPCRELKRTGRFAPTVAQKRFGALMGPLSMTGGFLISSLANEFLADPNIHLCAEGLVVQLSTERQQQRATACTQAYNDWVSTRKIVNYMPDLMSMTVTSLIQGYLINLPVSWAAKKAAGSISEIATRMLIANESRITTVLIRSISIAANFAPGGPLVRFGMQAAGALVFVTINDYVLPYIKFPFERYRQGKDITGDINKIYAELDRVEKNNWVWTPKPPPEECAYQPTAIDYANGYIAPYYCGRKTLGISELVGQLNDKYKKWRETMLADAYSSHDNWKDYITQFQNTYADSYRFDSDLLYSIAWKRTPGATHDARVDKLFSSVPLNGLDSGFFTDVCKMPDDKRKAFTEATTYAKQTLDALKAHTLGTYDRNEIENLTKVYVGLKAADCGQTTAAIETADAAAAPDSGNPDVQRINLFASGTANQVAQLNSDVRATQVRNALDTITHILNGYSALSVNVGNLGFGIGSVVPARDNPFYQLNQILGDSRPQAEGAAYLNDLENDDTIISQDGKDQHPGFYANARTSSMSNYLLASMVCGPTIGDAKAIDAHAFAQKQRSLFEKTLNLFGFDFDLTNRLINSKSMIYVEYADHDASALLSGIYGVRANFRPPSIVKLPGADAGRNLCHEMPKLTVSTDQLLYDPRIVQFNIGGQPFNGFLDVVKKYADSGIIGADKDNFHFTDFWSKSVDVHVTKVLDLFRNDFKHIIETKFIPNFVRTDTKTYNGRTFEIGTAKSLESQTHLNLLLLGKSLFPKTAAPAGDLATKRAEFLKLTQEFQREMRLQLDLLSDGDPATNAMATIESYAYQNNTTTDAPNAQTTVRTRMQKDFDANQTSMMALLKQIQAVPNGRDQASADAAKTLTELGDASAKAIEALVTETGSYYGIIDTIHVEGLL